CKQSYSFDALSRQTRNPQRRVNPAKQPYGLGLGVAQSPDRPLAPPATVVDNSREPCRPADTFPNPREKPTTRRNQRHVETLVHVVRALRSVISVGVDEDRTVVVDAVTTEMREQLIGDGEYGSALRRREAYAEKPVVQIVVVPLNFVKESGRAPNS